MKRTIEYFRRNTGWRLWAAAILGIAAGTPALRAQGGELNRQVEVSKEYRPDVDRAVKLGITPQMIDTVTLRPESEYVIRPSAWHTGFGVDPIVPARVDASLYRPLKPFYLKAGLGYPVQGELNFYGDRTTDEVRFGGYANLYSHNTDVENDYANTLRDRQSDSRIGIYGERRWKRAVAGAEAGYDLRSVTYYGKGFLAGNPDSEEVTLSDYLSTGRQRFSMPHLRLWAGHDFSDLSRFNVRFDGNIYTMTDRYRMNETGGDLAIRAGRLFAGKHRIEAKLSWEGYTGGKKLSYTDRILSAEVRYGIETEKFKLTVGATYIYDDGDENGYCSNTYHDISDVPSYSIPCYSERSAKRWFFPSFRMTFDVTSGYFVPFVEAGGRLHNYGYRNTILWNPYVSPGILMENTFEYNLRGGISGSISSAFAYRAFAGTSVYKWMNMFISNNFVVLDPDYTWGNGQFTSMSDDATMFTLGGELDGRIAGSFFANLSAQCYSYAMKKLEKAGDRPNFDASLALRYNYRDKFSAQAGVTLIGRRYAYQSTDPANPFSGFGTLYPNKIDPVMDINVELQYRLSHFMRLYLAGRNLGNSKLYYFNHYPSIGVNGRAGVVLSF